MSGPSLPEWEFSQDVPWIAGNLEIIPTSNCESWKDIGNSSKSLNITRHTLAKTGYAKCFVKCEIFIPEKLFYMELEAKWPHHPWFTCSLLPSLASLKAVTRKIIAFIPELKLRPLWRQQFDLIKFLLDAGIAAHTFILPTFNILFRIKFDKNEFINLLVPPICYPKHSRDRECSYSNSDNCYYRYTFSKEKTKDWLPYYLFQ